MAWRLFVDSTEGVTVEPEYSMTQLDEQLQNSHRARSGAGYRYVWGSYRKWKLPVRLVDSSFMSSVNTYWKAGTVLLFKSESLSAVYTVAITNKNLPIGQFEKPYMDLYQGIIELEAF